MCADEAKIVTAVHNSRPCMALEYSKPIIEEAFAEEGFVKYLESCMNTDHKNVLIIKGLYYPLSNQEYQYPMLITDSESLENSVANTIVPEVNQV